MQPYPSLLLHFTEETIFIGGKTLQWQVNLMGALIILYLILLSIS